MKKDTEIGNAQLNIAAGTHKGKVVRLTKTPFVVGRGVDCDFVDIGPGVSRRHCVLRKECGAWTIEDVGSSNGIVVNGRKIVGKTRLYYHDRVAIGEMGFVFEDPDNRMLNPKFSEKQKIEVVATPAKESSLIAFMVLFIMIVGAGLFIFHTVSRDRRQQAAEEVQVREVIDRKVLITHEEPDLLPDLVFFETRPAGATVILNGERAGRTPFAMTEGFKKSNIYEVLLEGYKLEKGSLVFPADKPKVSITLTQKPGTFLLTSKKPGVSIYHGEHLIGKTPKLLTDWKPGQYELRFNDYGYSAVSHKIQIGNGVAGKLTVELKPYTCRISVVSTPPGCSVYVDEVFMGRTKVSNDQFNVRSAPLVLEGLRPGAHVVKVVSKAGKVYKWKIARLTGDEVYKVNADFNRLTREK